MKKQLLLFLCLSLLTLTACDTTGQSRVESSSVSESRVESSSVSESHAESSSVSESSVQSTVAGTNTYQAPTNQTDIFSDCIVEYGGDLYQLPLPVSALLENGWEIQEGMDTLASDTQEKVVFTRGEEEFKYILANRTTTDLPIGDCIITHFESAPFGVLMQETPLESEKSALPTVVIAKGITEGTTLEEVERALVGELAFRDDTMSEFVTYFYVDQGTSAEDNQRNYFIAVSKKTEVVIYIVIQTEETK